MRIDISHKTLAQLRAFTAEDVRKNRTVYLTDRGKEGEWLYDSTDTTSADNLGTILVTASGARYKRTLTDYVKPDWFGALGDGTTNDTTALQAAFNLQKDVSISKGIYLVNGEIEIFGNVYCEKDAILKIANGYSGNLFKITAKKRLLIDNIYIDALGSTNDPNTGAPSIACTGLKVTGLWNSTINNFTMLSHSTSTSNVGIDLVSSPASGQPFGLAFGVYCVDINNPNISRGGIGIRTNKQTSEINNFITHLSIRSGWITEQETYNFHLQYAYQTIIENVATDTIKLNTGVGYKIANSNQMNLLLGEYNIDPDTPDTALLIDIDDATCSFIDVVASRAIKSALIAGTNYSLRSANTLRFRPTIVNGYYTEIKGDYSYGEPFVIQGKFDGGGALRKILKYDNTNFLTTEGNLIKTSKPRVQNVTSSSTLTPNSTNDEVVNITALATNVTIAAPSGTPVNGQIIKFRITDDGTPRTITWNAIYRGVGLTLPTTTVALVPLYIHAEYNSWDSKWDITEITGTLATLTGSEALTNKSVNGVTLATGGSASLFLNQQGSYVAASGGGGATQSVYHLTTGVSDSAGTLIEITPFTFSIVAGRKYKIELIGAYSSLTTTTGIILAVSTVTAGGGVIRGYMSGSVASGTVATELKTSISSVSYGTAGSYITTTGVNPINTPHAIEANLAFNCTTTGQLGFFFSTEVTSSLATLLAGTMVFVTEFA